MNDTDEQPKKKRCLEETTGPELCPQGTADDTLSPKRLDSKSADEEELDGVETFLENSEEEGLRRLQVDWEKNPLITSAMYVLHNDGHLIENTTLFIPLDTINLILELACFRTFDVMTAAFCGGDEDFSDVHTTACGVTSLSESLIAVAIRGIVLRSGERSTGGLAIFDTNTKQRIGYFTGFDQPTAVVAVSEDTVVVADCNGRGMNSPDEPNEGNCLCVLSWSVDQTTFVVNFVRRIGRYGEGANEFWCPYTLARISADAVLVADQGNERFQVVNWKDGTFVKAIPYFGRPTSIAAVTSDTVVIACWRRFAGGDNFFEVMNWVTGTVLRSIPGIGIVAAISSEYIAVLKNKQGITISVEFVRWSDGVTVRSIDMIYSRTMYYPGRSDLRVSSGALHGGMLVVVSEGLQKGGFRHHSWVINPLEGSICIATSVYLPRYI